MTAENFQRAMARVLVHEGGYSNHPADPGGVTLEGVTQRVYDGYRRRKGLPTRPLTAAMRSTADWRRERDEIYRLQYWNQCLCDELPAGLDYVVFDGAVNSGPSQSIKWAQRALGLPADGVMGQRTLAAIENHPDHDALVAAICSRRMAFLRALSTWPNFSRGWTSRVNGVRAVGQAWASGSVGPETVPAAGSGRRALLSDAKPAPATAPADAATGAGVGSGAGAGALQQAQDALSPIAGTSTFVATVVAVLAVTGVALVVGGLAWRWYATRKAQKREDALDLQPRAEQFVDDPVTA